MNDTLTFLLIFAGIALILSSIVMFFWWGLASTFLLYSKKSKTKKSNRISSEFVDARPSTTAFNSMWSQDTTTMAAAGSTTTAHVSLQKQEVDEQGYVSIWDSEQDFEGTAIFSSYSEDEDLLEDEESVFNKPHIFNIILEKSNI